MSVRALTWAWDQSPGNALAKLVLLKLADNADDKYRAWPSYPTIAEQCCCDRRTAIRKVAELHKLGFIAVFPEERNNGSESSNVYQLKPTAQQLEESRALTEARQKPKTAALKASQKNIQGSDAESLPSDSVTLPPPSDTESLPSDTTVSLGECQPDTRGVSESHSYMNHSFNHSFNRQGTHTHGGGRQTTPFDEFANPDNYPDFISVAEAWRAHGNGDVKPRDIALYRKHVAESRFEEQFLIGAQNYLNDKASQRGARYKNLDTFIREESWRIEQPIKAGPIRVRGAPIPPTEHQATGQRVAAIIQNDPLKVIDA